MKAGLFATKYDRHLEGTERCNELTCPKVDSESATKQIATIEFRFNNKLNNMVKVQLPANLAALGF